MASFTLVPVLAKRHPSTSTMRHHPSPLRAWAAAACVDRRTDYRTDTRAQADADSDRPAADQDADGCPDTRADSDADTCVWN
jgi:hypothetical protein